ncbi:MAG: type IV toxin-antitoxin system AbiEi family antitoxin domain-containing protein [Gemmatimonadota bacterium]|jgi:very-short-patch-repair endonuclease
MPDGRDRQIEELAARQHGVVTRAQLLSMGVSASAIGRRARAGRLRRAHAGVYLVGPIQSPRAPEMAAVLAGGPGAVLSHENALQVLGMSRRDRPRPIHVTVPGSGRGKRPGIRFHRVATLARDEEIVVDGMPVTSPARTLADVAGRLGHGEVELALARAERAALVTAEEMADLPRRYAGRPGAPLLRAVVEARAGPSLTRSEAERRCLALLAEARLPRPYVNVPVGPYELDLFWPDLGVAVEIDGYAHHASRARFEGDRRKDRWLHARGIRVVRLTWRQITQQAIPTVVEVARILAGAEQEVRTRGERFRSREPAPARPVEVGEGFR